MCVMHFRKMYEQRRIFRIVQGTFYVPTVSSTPWAGFNINFNKPQYNLRACTVGPEWKAT